MPNLHAAYVFQPIDERAFHPCSHRAANRYAQHAGGSEPMSTMRQAPHVTMFCKSIDTPHTSTGG